MQDHRSLKKAWQLTESNWRDSKENVSDVNTGMTKREKMMESQKIREGMKSGLPKSWKGKGKKVPGPGGKDIEVYDLDNPKNTKKKTKESKKKKYDDELEEEEGAVVSVGAPGSEGGDDGGYDSDAQNNIAVNAKRLKLGKKGVQTRNESVEAVLNRAFNKAIMGESIVTQEEEDEDMGMDDDMPDMDDPEGDMEEPVDDMGGEAPIYDLGAEMPMDAPVEDPVAGAGVDPIEARLAAIEARLASIESEHAAMGAGEAGPEEIGDLGDELPAEMGGEYDDEGDVDDLEGDEESDIDFDDEEEDEEL